MGFDDVYRDGKYDGEIEGKLKMTSVLLDMGIDEEIISKSAGISISKIKKFKRKL